MFFLLYRWLDQAGWHFGLASVAQRMSSCHNISLMLSFHFSLQCFSYKYIISYVLYYISIILCITIISYLYTSSTDSSMQTICLLSAVGQQYLVGTITPHFARGASSSCYLLEYYHQMDTVLLLPHAVTYWCSRHSIQLATSDWRMGRHRTATASHF